MSTASQAVSRFVGGCEVTCNGAQYPPTVWGGPPFVNPGVTQIGDGASQYSLDEVSFYERALVQTQISAHYQAGTGGASGVYQHKAFDANGNLLWVSLPTRQSNPANVAAADKTINEYWDGGAIYSTLAPAAPKVRYDYTAEGWQSSSVPETTVGSGVLDSTRLMLWRHLPDGKLREQVDASGLRATFTYDADGNELTATAALGMGSASAAAPVTITATYDGFDQLVKTRQPKNQNPNFWATTFAYDQHGNVVQVVQNQDETAAGAIVTAGRTIAYTYDLLDEPTVQTDDFATPASAADDERVTFTYTPTGLESGRTLSKSNGSGGWTTEQQVAESYYSNGLLKTLVTTNGGSTTFASHALSYVDLNGNYVNGNKTQDVFLLHGPDASASCYSTTCTASWRYDSRDRLIQETNGTGTTTQYGLDVYGNIVQQTDNGVVARTATYNGLQLVSDTVNGFVTKYFYDASGNLQCTTTTNWATSSCPSISGTIDPSLVTYNIYDTKNRLLATRKYSSGTLTDSADYVLDALDRTLSQTETHTGTTTRTDFTYLAHSRAVAQEQLFNSAGTLTETKQYAYDPAGTSLTLADTVASTTTRYSYLFNPQQSVELLIDQAGTPKAAYGYTAYGNTNLSLTKTAAGFDPKTNPYKFNDARFDTGSGTIDMGARRYSATLGRFLQRDVYADALSNLGLSMGELGNRYSFEGANPINFVEVDGHSYVCVTIGVFGGQCTWSGQGTTVSNTTYGLAPQPVTTTNQQTWAADPGAFNSSAGSSSGGNTNTNNDNNNDNGGDSGKKDDSPPDVVSQILHMIVSGVRNAVSACLDHPKECASAQHQALQKEKQRDKVRAQLLAFIGQVANLLNVSPSNYSKLKIEPNARGAGFRIMQKGQDVRDNSNVIRISFKKSGAIELRYTDKGGQYVNPRTGDPVFGRTSPLTHVDLRTYKGPFKNVPFQDKLP